GSVLVDVAIDQGGCFETSKATTHQNPTYEVDGIIHYCVANMPGGVARTSTFALTNATLPFALQLADKGTQALLDDPHLLDGLNVHAGKITYEAVSRTSFRAGNGRRTAGAGARSSIRPAARSAATSPWPRPRRYRPRWRPPRPPSRPGRRRRR